MGKLRRVMRCYHCGAVLQSKNKNESGYIEKELLEAENAEQLVLYCRTCHDKMSVINAGMLGQDVDDEILKVLDDAVATDALILWVVDLFNFNGTLNPDVVKKVFDVLVPRYKERKGGYTQILKLGTRKGDSAEMAIVKLVI